MTKQTPTPTPTPRKSFVYKYKPGLRVPPQFLVKKFIIVCPLINFKKCYHSNEPLDAKTFISNILKDLNMEQLQGNIYASDVYYYKTSVNKISEYAAKLYLTDTEERTKYDCLKCALKNEKRLTYDKYIL